MSKHIVEMFDKANLQDIEEGKTWYENARSFCLNISSTTPYSLEQVVAVVAALSPRNRWETNKLDATRLITRHRQILGNRNKVGAVDPMGCNLNNPSGLIGPESVTVSTFHQNKIKAWKILDGEPIGSVIGGPKVNSFYLNILHPDSEEVVTVDGHAANIYRGEVVVGPVISPKQYVEIANSYKDTGRFIGMKACQLQAVTWNTYRRINGI